MPSATSLMPPCSAGGPGRLESTSRMGEVNLYPAGELDGSGVQSHVHVIEGLRGLRSHYACVQTNLSKHGGAAKGRHTSTEKAAEQSHNLTT
jgi:hypothetical protein